MAPLIRLLGDLAKPARTSVRLASDPELDGVTGRYLNAKGKWARWPAGVLAEANREAVLALCERLAAGRVT
ncbi:hypothetical protein [Streptomyces sp. 8K308]|uniref:hypothetical protein n=1 Tax=Streptomyces sp. 8K308 TaxID=2530388 RepID=UPI001A9DD061|nr:hypothetical protein [Streptomyces sp. 8K308]